MKKRKELCSIRLDKHLNYYALKCIITAVGFGIDNDKFQIVEHLNKIKRKYIVLYLGSKCYFSSC